VQQKKSIMLFTTLLISLILPAFSLAVTDAVKDYIAPSVWPMPVSSQYGSTPLFISSEILFKTKSHGNYADIKTLSAAYERYQFIMFPHSFSDDSNSPSVNEITVAVDNSSEDYPQLDTDESYELSISDTGNASIVAATVYGALRALETLSQLVVYNYDLGSYLITNAPVYIEDYPRYQHRGLLLDTSRHFQPIAELERTIDSLSYAKYNGKCRRTSHAILNDLCYITFSIALARRGLPKFSLPVHLLPQAMDRCIHTCREVSPGRHYGSSGVRPQ
jgi:hypothetical protein